MTDASKQHKVDNQPSFDIYKIHLDKSASGRLFIQGILEQCSS